MSIIDDSTNKIDTMQAQVGQIKASGRKVPDDLFKRIDNEKHQVAVQNRLMESHKKRRDEIARQFNDYIERFNALKAEQKAKREALAKKRGEI
jgi:hypothetical protein